MVEGFYGRPYTFDQRKELIDFLSSVGLNTYIYGPKSDPYHRRNWRKPYPRKKLGEFEALLQMGRKRSVRFVYALSPVHDPCLPGVIEKIDTLRHIGISHFSLFFDDIKVRLCRATAERQLRIANGLYEHLARDPDDFSLFFCPTQYRGFKDTEYISHIAKNLHPQIDIFWTGKKVVSPEITKNDIDMITGILHRPVLIWDNIFANDYLFGKIHRFAYHGRDASMISKIRGIVINPMNNLNLSKPLIYTAAAFFRNPAEYDPVSAWQKALRYYTGKNS